VIAFWKNFLFNIQIRILTFYLDTPHPPLSLKGRGTRVRVKNRRNSTKRGGTKR